MAQENMKMSIHNMMQKRGKHKLLWSSSIETAMKFSPNDRL